MGIRQWGHSYGNIIYNTFYYHNFQQLGAQTLLVHKIES